MRPGGEAGVNSPGYWNRRYREGETGWDLGSPTPVFLRLLADAVLPPAETIVLGCGKGHDAVAFARHGHRVTAVDFSAEAVEHTRALAAESGIAVSLLCTDLFTLVPEYAGRFDCAVEYVTYCAIEPSRRGEFADVVSALLKPGGMLVALLFPLERRKGGPPFGVDADEARTLFGRTLHEEVARFHPETIASRRGRELLTIWRKPPSGS